VLVPVAAHALWDHVEIRRLVGEIEAIRAAGEPVTEHEAGRAYSGTTEEHRTASRQYLAAAMLALGGLRNPEMEQLREWVHGAEAQFVWFRPMDGAALIGLRTARVAVAIERFRRAHAGALPAGLDDLVPVYLAEVPQDPLSGGPLLYRRDSHSYRVYSVGVDGNDAGGDLASELHETIKRGWGRRIVRGRDVGIRVVLH
jgi:hypothetical protein